MFMTSARERGRDGEGGGGGGGGSVGFTHLLAL